MSCLKCGKKTADEHGFCQRCLEVMEQYPVDPDVHVQLPSRHTHPDGKKPVKKRRVLSAEEQLPLLRLRLRRLAIITFVLLVLLGVTIGLLLRGNPVVDEFDIGKNYTFGNPFG